MMAPGALTVQTPPGPEYVRLQAAGMDMTVPIACTRRPIHHHSPMVGALHLIAVVLLAEVYVSENASS